jgi:hypothetical protein
LHLDIGAVVTVAGAVRLRAVLLVLLAAAALCRSLGGFLGLEALSGRCGPSWNFPNNTREALEGEASTSPLATWLARSIERSKAGVDSTLVCLGTKLVSARGSTGGVVVIDGSIFTVATVSTLVSSIARGSREGKKRARRSK